MTQGTTNNQLAARIDSVHQQIGALVEGQKGAERGRAVLHEKLDKVLDAIQVQAIQLAEVSKDAVAAGLVAAQTRDRMDALDREMTPVITELKQQGKDLADQIEGLKATDEEAKPLLDTVKQARNLLAVLLVISGSGVVGIGTVFAFFNDAARQAVKSWLGLA